MKIDKLNKQSVKIGDRANATAEAVGAFEAAITTRNNATTDKEIAKADKALVRSVVKLEKAAYALGEKAVKLRKDLED